MKILKWLAVGFVVFMALGVIIDLFDGSDPADTTAKPAAKADSGRMSGGEHDQMQRSISGFSREATDFAEQMGGKCHGLAGAGELAAFSDCVKDAHSGVDDKALFARSILSDLMDDTKGACRRAVSRLRNAVDHYATAMKTVAELGEGLSGDAEATAAAGENVPVRHAMFVQQSSKTDSACSPD